MLEIRQAYIERLETTEQHLHRCVQRVENKLVYEEHRVFEAIPDSTLVDQLQQAQQAKVKN
eukprot:6565452-Prorocentrum_lima.AAC.1